MKKIDFKNGSFEKLTKEQMKNVNGGGVGETGGGGGGGCWLYCAIEGDICGMVTYASNCDAFDVNITVCQTMVSGCAATDSYYCTC